MKLTCVTAVFNPIKAGNKESLIRCVETVAAVKTEHEHLLIDGASTDGTVEILKELAAKYPNVSYVSEKDTGIYNALNKGLKAAKGEYFYVLGCDDHISHPEVMDALIAEEDPETEMIVAPVEYDGDPNYAFQKMRDLERLFRWGYCFCHQGVIMKTELARKCGGFDESYRYCADGDMWMKIHKMGVPFHYTLKAFANFGAGGANENQRAQVLSETERFVKTNLELTENEAKLFTFAHLVPYRVVHKYYNSKDLAFRTSSRSLMDFYMRDFMDIIWAFMRKCFIPFVRVFFSLFYALQARKDKWYIRGPFYPLRWLRTKIRGY